MRPRVIYPQTQAPRQSKLRLSLLILLTQ